MKINKSLFITGLVGTILTLLCCLTPILVILLGVVGLGAVTGYLDYMLMPLFVIFAGLTSFAYRKQKKLNSNITCCSTINSSESRER